MISEIGFEVIERVRSLLDPGSRTAKTTSRKIGMCVAMPGNYFSNHL